MTKEELQIELKALIVSALGLEDIKPEDIETDAPLFVDGLGLDSIDALELGLAIKKKYGITMSAEKRRKQESTLPALPLLPTSSPLTKPTPPNLFDS